MATLEHIAIRRADAEARIATAAGVISGALGVDPPVAEAAHPMAPYPAELGAALYAEGIAAYLEAVAASVAGQREEMLTAACVLKAHEESFAKAMDSLAAVEAERDAVKAELDAIKSESPAVAADSSPAPRGDTVSDENNPTKHVDAEGEPQPLDKPAAHEPDGGSIAGKDAGGDFGATTLADVGAAPATGGEAPDPADVVPEAPKTAKKGS